MTIIPILAPHTLTQTNAPNPTRTYHHAHTYTRPLFSECTEEQNDEATSSGKRRRNPTESEKSPQANKRNKVQQTLTPPRRSGRTPVKERKPEPLRRVLRMNGKWEVTHSVKRVRPGIKCNFHDGTAIVRVLTSATQPHPRSKT